MLTNVKPVTLFSLMLGIASFIGLLIWQGIGEVTSTLATAGWGLTVVAAFHLIPMLSSGVCWRILLPARHRLPLSRLVEARWIGESINSILPVAQIGGEFAKARWVMRNSNQRNGIPGSVAGSSVVVEVTISLLTQIIFTIIGLSALLFYLDLNSHLVVEVAVGIAIMIALLMAFYASQHHNLFERVAHLLEKISGGKQWLKLSGGANTLDQAIVNIYSRKTALATASAWRLLSWFLGIGEVWLIMYFLGHPISLMEALLLESLGQAIRAAGFLIPASLGVQEGGFLLLGIVLGIPSQTALALSLGKRIRELILGIPGLIIWQIGTWKTGAGQRLSQHRQGKDQADQNPEHVIE
ncbi:MAG: flippase-like domain-containing protein [Mariprofundus sp.]|nr:flippase-like domain-containing protein [Mariprofundus sp.]